MQTLSYLLVILFANFSLILNSHAFERLPIQLAKAFKYSADINQYWISEKLDGVRGYWNGTSLFTRGGFKVNAPDWFIKDFPNQPLDGELWIERGKFEVVSSIVRQKSAKESDWKLVKFMVFDLNNGAGTFTERLQTLKTIIPKGVTTISLIHQFKVNDEAELDRIFKQYLVKGAEGLMLHHQDARYKNGRQAKLMKLKPFEDAEARVVAHIPGKGKFKGLMGAIQVVTPENITFKIGSGFTELERHNPPPIGSIITYKYSGKTNRGTPRFASFLRIRTDAKLYK